MAVKRVERLLVVAIALGCAGEEATLNVTTPTPSRVEISPPSASVVAGTTRQLSATVFDASNAQMPGVAVTWSSADPAIATVGSSGLVSAVAPGGATIRAAASSVSATAAITVTAPVAVVARVQLAPAAVTLTVGGSATLAATAFDAQNAVVSGRAVSFTSSNAAVATVSGLGVVTANTPGAATITATIDGIAATSSITVNASTSNGVVTSVVVQPSTLSVVVGGTVQLVGTPNDAQGNAITGKSVTWSSVTPAVATVSPLGVVTGVSVGTSVIRATVDGVSGTATATVLTAPTGNNIVVNTSQTFQTISGWDGAAGLGETDCHPTAYAIYKGPVVDRAINELGITRVRLGLRSGLESPVDNYQRFLSGQLTYTEWEATWFTPVNDNTDPNTANAAGFQWSYLDFKIDEVVLPLMQRMQARGEKLYVTLNYVDFAKGAIKSFIHIKQPDEYAEFVVAAFQHIKQKYGWSPDALEVLLEPSNVGGSNTVVTGTDLGRAIVATGSRLAAAGFTPEFVGPSDASMAASVTFYDAMILVPGVMTYLKEFSYHRYIAVSPAALQAIAFRGQRDNVRTSMLEWNQADIDTLIEDLVVGNVSGWEQFNIAYCGNRTNPGASGIYYQVDQTVPSNPIITMTYDARDYRQIFAYVRPGAVRLGAVSGNPSLLSTVAFRNANGKHVVVVRSQAGAAFQLQGLPPGTYGVNFNSQAQNGVSLGDLVVTTAGTLSSATPSKGIVTFFQR